MSVTNRIDVKIVLPRSGPDDFWQLLMDDFAGNDPLKWKYLAMLALRENSGWPLAAIGVVFNHPKGHVSRCLKNIKARIRERYTLDEDPFAAAEECPVVSPESVAA